MNTTATVAVIVAVVALAAAIWAVWQTQRTKHLRTKFGPEYDYTVEREGDRRKAEAELAEREAKAKRLQIRELTPQEREQFASAWRDEQTHFVENPGQAVAAAD